jgi:phosphate transport system permease protein
MDLKRTNRLKIRNRIEENIFIGLMIVSTAIIILCLFLIIATIFIKGLSAFNIKMITQTPKGGYYLGKEGGILNAIIGSLYLGLGSTFLGFCISFPIAVYLNVYAGKKRKFSFIIRLFLDILCGVPSIVFGAFGLILMYFFKIRTSLLAAIITVSILIFPIMCRAIDEIMQMVPRELYEASYSLGSTKAEIGFKVILKQILPSVCVIVLLAFGRGIGDAASVLFTAGFTDNIPNSLFRPVATLPLAIFFQLTSPAKEVQNRAYASAFILTLIILIISIITRIIKAKFSKFTYK